MHGAGDLEGAHKTYKAGLAVEPGVVLFYFHFWEYVLRTTTAHSRCVLEKKSTDIPFVCVTLIFPRDIGGLARSSAEGQHV